MERPILFSAPMVRAILDGRKTQTRRLVKSPTGQSFRSLFRMSLGDNNAPPFGCFASFVTDGTNSGNLIRCPYTDGTVGDRLWVRETWAGATEPSLRDEVLYRADGEKFVAEPKWRPSIHMPRWASRITLSVESVRVERLHDISEEDARAEGAPYYVNGEGPVGEHEINVDGGYHGMGSRRAGFEWLWNEVNGWTPPAWDANPWVWVISFSRVTP